MRQETNNLEFEKNETNNLESEKNENIEDSEVDGDFSDADESTPKVEHVRNSVGIKSKRWERYIGHRYMFSEIQVIQTEFEAK